jgi:hypothetical protein
MKHGSLHAAGVTSLIWAWVLWWVRPDEHGRPMIVGGAAQKYEATDGWEDLNPMIQKALLESTVSKP